MPLILGIDTEKIDEKFINKYLEHYELTTGGKINRKLRILARHIAELKEAQSEEEFDSCTCSNCGGESPGDLDDCPFCGEGDDEELAAGRAVGTVQSERVTPESIEEYDEQVEPDPQPKVSRSEAAAKKKATKKKATKKKATKKTTAGETTPKGKTPAKKKTPARKAQDVKEAAAAEVLPTTTVAKHFTEVDLNLHEAAIRQHMVDAATQCYNIGRELKVIADANLYLLRMDSAGKKSKYKSFKAYVRQELSMAKDQAYKFMAVAAHFTEDEIRAMGVEKLNLALKVPESVRQEILDGAEAGETMSQLSNKANDLLGKDPKPKKVKPGAGITAIIAMGLLETAAYKRPTKPGKVNELTTPAKKLGDEPFGVFQLENDVQAVVQLVKDADGELKFALTFSRVVGEEV